MPGGGRVSEAYNKDTPSSTKLPRRSVWSNKRVWLYFFAQWEQISEVCLVKRAGATALSSHSVVCFFLTAGPLNSPAAHLHPSFFLSAPAV